jgi:hypothetical protein
MASMGSLVEFPELVENTFVTNTVNDAGIYAVRFFIRGKPWIVTVDDEVAVVNNVDGSSDLLFADAGAGGSLWGPILEKAWAKMKGTY